MHALADAEWRDATPEPAPLPDRVWLPSVQVLVCRARAGQHRGLALAAKGGTNDENHNHKDLGSFIVAAHGRPLLVDIGKPTYTAQTFSAARYGIRAMQSGWHNAPAPHDLEQGEGPAFLAKVVQRPDASVGLPVSLSLDLSRAYPLGDAEHWNRVFRLVSGERIEIVDTWRLEAREGRPAVAAVHLIAAGSVSVQDGAALVTEAGRGIRVTTAEGVLPATEEWELDDPELIRVWGPHLTRLTYPIDVSAGSLTTIVEEVEAW